MENTHPTLQNLTMSWNTHSKRSRGSRYVFFSLKCSHVLINCHIRPTTPTTNFKLHCASLFEHTSNSFRIFTTALILWLRQQRQSRRLVGAQRRHSHLSDGRAAVVGRRATCLQHHPKTEWFRDVYRPPDDVLSIQ